MSTGLLRIDHAHVQVADKELAAAWFARVLDLHPLPAFAEWNQETGPLIIANPAGTVKLALFLGGTRRSETVAFGVAPEEFDVWVRRLRDNDVPCSEMDHRLARSVYFEDLDGNWFEITAYAK